MKHPVLSRSEHPRSRLWGRGHSDVELRLELVASHLIGLAFARYQLKLEPIASTGVDQLVASIRPTIERYLADPAALSK